MNDFYTGIVTTLVLIGLIEVLKYFDRRLIGSLTLVAIAFIYIGFSWKDTPSLIYSILSAAVFSALSYFGYKKNFILIITGLALHGVWDIVFPLFSSAAPHGYSIFCITIDILLAIYFYVRIKPLKSV